MTGEFSLAVHAVVYLNHKKSTVSSEELAKNICTNPARVRKVMAKLKRGGLVQTKEGADGGYLFEENPKLSTLLMISDALGERFVSASWRPGDADMDCLVASGMAGVMDGIYEDLDKRCKQRLKEITIDDIDKLIFK